jgi:protein phosphatase
VHNEDAFVVDAQLGLAVVADGVGGHQAGEIASELVCNRIISQVRAGSDLTAAVEAANVALLAPG